MNFLDKSGLTRFWNKIKTEISKKATLSGYIKSTSASRQAIVVSDTLNIAIGKLEKRIEIDESSYTRAYSAYQSFGNANTEITTAQFITMLTNLGAFNQPAWCARGSWSYARNQVIKDTGIGKICLAGCTVEVIGNANNYTIRIVTPTTSSGGGERKRIYYYIYNGTSYSPAWFKIARADELDAIVTRVTKVEKELSGVSSSVTALESAAR